MPRQSVAKVDSITSSLYNPQYSPYNPPISSGSSSPSVSPPLRHSSTSISQQKKKHICATCDRAFTTSGHLARHARIHTGERNHKCPFPGCETRCSRQDNLQQHYRIHLSPGSRRSSSSVTRQAIARAMSNDTHSSVSSKRSSSASISGLVAPPSPPTEPPALEPARLRMPSPPPDSPPPLAQATLPATLHHHHSNVSSRTSSSPELNFPDFIQHGNSHVLPGANSLSMQYRTGANGYQDHQHSGAFNYVSSHSNGDIHSHSMQGASFSYSSDYDDQASSHSPSSSPSTHLSVSSRHSISHISHPYLPSSHPPSGSSSPASNASSHSPNMAAYSLYRDGSGSFNQGTNGIDSMADHVGISAYHNPQSAQLVQNSYMSMQPSHRYESPPPILAPIQDERVVRGDHRSFSEPSAFVHSSQPSNYHYYQSGLSSIGHAWKSDYSVRGRGALVQ